MFCMVDGTDEEETINFDVLLIAVCVSWSKMTDAECLVAIS